MRIGELNLKTAAMTGNKKYRVALIGAGRMGARWAKIISASKRASLALVVDEDVSRARMGGEAYGAAHSGSSTDAFGVRIDAVCIATPHKFLYPLAKEALLAGKHVFVEKPGSKTAEEMCDLIRLAKEHKRALTVGFNYRFFDSLRQVRKIVDAGTIGEAVSLRITHGHPGRPGYEKEWRMNKELAGGGVLMDQGLHCIDLALWFLNDRAARVFGSTNNHIWKTGVEDSAVVVLETARKKTAALCVSIGEWKPVFSLHILGEKGYIAIGGLGRKYGDGARFTLGRYDRKAEKLSELVIACNPDADEALRLEFAEFVRVMEKRTPTGNATDALRVLEIVEKIYAEA